MTRALVATVATVALALGSCSASAGKKRYGCTATHGGSPYECWQALALDTPRPETGKSYHSAGTMSLAAATCIRRDSSWWFHGAHDPKLGFIVERGNEEMRRAYARFPALVRYLDDRGALQTVSWTKLSGADLGRLGVPICK